MQQPSARSGAVPLGLLAVGLVVLGVLFVLAVIGLALRPHPIFVIDAAGSGYCFAVLARLSRRRLAARSAE
jgi:hypothetical protein